jgi:hypothetical protein
MIILLCKERAWQRLRHCSRSWNACALLFRPVTDPVRNSASGDLKRLQRERTDGMRRNQPQGSEGLACLHCTRLRCGLDTQ